jgi:hypothetical protein
MNCVREEGAMEVSYHHPLLVFFGRQEEVGVGVEESCCGTY